MLALLSQIFSQPIIVPTSPAGLLWALPICFSIAVVYKALKLNEFQFKSFAREVILLFLTIIAVLVGVALILMLVAKWVNIV